MNDNKIISVVFDGNLYYIKQEGPRYLYSVDSTTYRKLNRCTVWGREIYKQYQKKKISGLSGETKNLKDAFIESKGGKCFGCGLKYSSETKIVFDIHHLNPSKKSINIGKYFHQNKKISVKIHDELKNCIPLCANCHRMIHNKPMSGVIS